MAKAGKIHHWKHGWIPLDAYARSIVAKREGKKTYRLTDAPTLDEHKKRTRKPPNWVPPSDNVPKWKAPSDADKVAATKKALTKDQKIAELNKRRAARGQAPLPNSEAGQAAKAAPRIKALKEAGPPSKVTYVGGKDGNGGIYKITDSKGTVLYRTKDRHSANAYMARNGVDFDKANDLTAEARSEASAAASARERYRKVTTVDGVDFVTYRSAAYDPLGGDHGEPREWTPEQMQITADAFNEVKAEFPGLEPVQFVATSPVTEKQQGVMGITSWDGRRISLLPDAFNDSGRAEAAKNFGRHGAIAGQFTDDPEAFSRSVVVHELGHALQMQKTAAKRRGEIIANERVTPDEVGIDTSKWEKRPTGTAPRWAVDTLNRQTMYGLGNEYEWFAEAFAEGWFNGDQATPEAKRVLAMLHSEYGKAAA